MSETRTASGQLDIGAYEAAPTTTTMPTPPSTSETWTYCAAQYGVCVVPGTREVRYGVAGSYATKIVTGSVRCHDDIFGNPKFGFVKSCSYSSKAR